MMKTEMLIRTKKFSIEFGPYLRILILKLLPRVLLTIVVVTLLVYAYCAWKELPRPMDFTLAAEKFLVPYCFGLSAAVTFFRASKSKTLLSDPRVMEFSEAGIHLTTSSGIETRLPLAKIIKVERRLGYTLLYIAPGQFYLVPDGCFESDADRLNFWQLFRDAGKLKAVPQ